VYAVARALQDAIYEVDKVCPTASFHLMQIVYRQFLYGVREEYFKEKD
jgi:hypothetical protein